MAKNNNTMLLLGIGALAVFLYSYKKPINTDEGNYVGGGGNVYNYDNSGDIKTTIEKIPDTFKLIALPGAQQKSFTSSGSYTPGVINTAGIKAPAVPAVVVNPKNPDILNVGFATQNASVFNATGKINTTTGAYSGYIPLDPAKAFLNKLNLKATK